MRNGSDLEIGLRIAICTVIIVIRRSVLRVHWKDWCWSWNSSTLATSCKELTHWKRLWCWEGLGAGGEEDNRGWDGWMASPTRWTWVWVNSRSWWCTGRHSMLWFMGSQRVGHDWVTELNWIVISLLFPHSLNFFIIRVKKYTQRLLNYLVLKKVIVGHPGIPEGQECHINLSTIVTIMPPQNSCPPEISIFGNWAFPYLVKISSYWFKVNPQFINSYLYREKKGRFGYRDMKRIQGKRPWMIQTEIQEMELKDKGYQGFLAIIRRKKQRRILF